MSHPAPLSWWLRLIHAVGQMPEGIKTASFGFFLLFYYNQVLGLSLLSIILVGFYAITRARHGDTLKEVHARSSIEPVRNT